MYVIAQTKPTGISSPYPANPEILTARGNAVGCHTACTGMSLTGTAHSNDEQHLRIKGRFETSIVIATANCRRCVYISLVSVENYRI